MNVLFLALSISLCVFGVYRQKILWIENEDLNEWEASGGMLSNPLVSMCVWAFLW